MVGLHKGTSLNRFCHFVLKIHNIQLSELHSLVDGLFFFVGGEILSIITGRDQ